MGQAGEEAEDVRVVQKLLVEQGEEGVAKPMTVEPITRKRLASTANKYIRIFVGKDHHLSHKSGYALEHRVRPSRSSVLDASEWII